jgi:5-methylcytosine-specific restriction endonuclease McrA
MRFDDYRTRVNGTCRAIDATIDHAVIKREHGGTRAAWNVKLAHAQCNSERDVKSADQLRRELAHRISGWLASGKTHPKRAVSC